MTLSDGFQLAATALDGVARLRELILSLAVAGKLVRQNSADEPAQTLLRKIRAEKDRLVAEGTISAGKPLMEIGDKERPFDLPPGWQWVRFGDYVIELCTGPFGSVIHKEDYVKDGIPLINPSHMVRGHILHDPSVSVSAQMAEQLSAYRLSAGDIVLARRGEVGRYAHVTSEQEGWLCGTGSFFAKLSDVCDRRFMGLVFQDPRMRAYLQGESVGMTMTNLNQRILLEAPLAIPPIAEQTRIVVKVDELMALCDNLEIRGQVEAEQHARLIATLFDALAASESPHALAENWSRVAAHFDLLLDRPEAVDALERAIGHMAVRGLLVPQDPTDAPAKALLAEIQAKKVQLIAEGKVKREKDLPVIRDEDAPFALPDGWAWARFPELGEFGRGKSKHRPRNDPTLFSPGVYPLIQTGDVARADRVIERFNAQYSESGLAQSRLWPAGTLCITIAANIADSAILGFDACFPDSVVGFVPVGELVDARYLLTFIETAKDDLTAFAPSTAQKNINLEILNNVLIPVPPRNETLRIVARVEELRNLCGALRARLIARQICQAHLAEALVGQAASPAPLATHLDDLAAAA